MTNEKRSLSNPKLHIRIDASDDKEYNGKPYDFFLCHTPLIKDSSGKEVVFVLQNEWPFVMSQVLEFPDEEAAYQFLESPAGQATSSLLVRNVVLRLSSALANVNPPHTSLSPEEVVDHVNAIFAKAGYWYRCTVMDKK